MENSQLKNSSDGSETPTIPLSPKQNIQPEGPLYISEDFADGINQLGHLIFYKTYFIHM